MQIEKSAEEQCEEFLGKVKRGYDWLVGLYEMMTPEQKQENDDDSDCPEIVSDVQNPGFKIIIMDDNLTFKASRFNFNELSSSRCSVLEKVTFERVFTYDAKLGYTIKNKYRNGVGFYSLAVEIISFYMVYNSKIIDASNLFDVLEYQPCTEENNFVEVCRNFWINFVTSIVYMLSYNIVSILACFDKMKEDFKEGKTLRNINTPFDLQAVFKLEELDLLLNFYEYYELAETKLFTPEQFDEVKDQILGYIELMGVIEPHIWTLVLLKINSSYFNFIMCTSFLHNEFNLMNGPISNAAPSYIASVKINLDKYIEEIIINGMDHFKEFTPQGKVRDSFFYHWRTLSGLIITDKNHIIKELFDEKFHAKIKNLINKIKADYQVFYDTNKGNFKRDHKRFEEKIKQTNQSYINLGLLVINIPCNFQNRFTQAELIKLIGEVQQECERDLKMMSSFH